jgi:protein ImuB
MELDWTRLDEEALGLEEALRTLCPDIEHERPGVIFARVRGVANIHQGETGTARALLQAATQLGHRGAVGLAGVRLAARRAARRALRDERELLRVEVGEDRAFLAGEPIEAVEDAELVERLRALGIRSLGELADLPSAELGQRLGPSAAHWWSLARGEERSPWKALREDEDWKVEVAAPGAVERLEALRFVMRPALERLCGSLARQGKAARALGWQLLLDRDDPIEGSTHAARPSASARLWNELLGMAFTRLSATSPVVGLRLEALGVVAEEGHQLQLLGSREAQPGALDRGLARVTAALGPDCFGTLLPGPHPLPEGRSRLEPGLPEILVGRPHGRSKARRPRLPSWRGSTVPRWLAGTPENGVAGALFRPLSEPELIDVQLRDGLPQRWRRPGREQTVVDAWAGPWDVSGGWWRDPGESEQPLARRYWLVGTRGAWALLKREDGSWFLEGWVD